MPAPSDPEFLLFYQPPCGKWYVHSHKLYGSIELARQAAQKFLVPGTPISILPILTDLLRAEIVSGCEPVPTLLHCPICTERHIDEGEFATKPHHTHACQSCGHVWRPAIIPTVGVQFLPGFKS